jgi:hypothetical protein
LEFKGSFLLVIHFSNDFGRDTEGDDIVRDIFINETESPDYWTWIARAFPVTPTDWLRGQYAQSSAELASALQKMDFYLSWNPALAGLHPGLGSFSFPLSLPKA